MKTNVSVFVVALAMMFLNSVSAAFPTAAFALRPADFSEAFKANALLELNDQQFTTRGDPLTDPNALEFPANFTYGDAILPRVYANQLLYGAGWEGNLNPQGAFATQHGRQLGAIIQQISDNGRKYRLSTVQLNFDFYSLETFGPTRPDLSKQITNFEYDGVGIEGFLFGPDNLFGTADDILVTDKNALVDAFRITSAGFGVNMNQFSGTPEEKRDQALALLNAEGPFKISANYLYPEFDALGNQVNSFGINVGEMVIEPYVSVIPEPATYSLMTVALLGLMLFLRNHKRRCSS